MTLLLEWHAKPNESLMVDTGDLRLTVEPPPQFVGKFRYTVLRRQYGKGSLFAVIETGAELRLHDAMMTAEQAALRLVPQD